MPSTVHLSLTQHDFDAEQWERLLELAHRRDRSNQNQIKVCVRYALRKSLEGVDIEPPQAVLLESAA